LKRTFAVSLELIRWVANELRLALLEDGEHGEVTANVHALAPLGGKAPADLLEGVEQLLGGGDGAEDAICSAREGRQAAYAPRPGVQVLAVPNGPGRAAVLITSQESPLAESIQAKAAAADLAAGVSHEVANALSAIVGWAQVARERPDKAPPEEALALIEKSALVARDATQDLLRMVRHTNHERTRADLSVVIRDVVRLLRPEAQTKRVKVHAEVEDSCWVEGKRSQLFSIVWNLAHNAVQMVPAGGEVSIHTRPRGTLIELEVRDNGPGMSEAQQERAFDPYYTTRSEGTGLGLAIVRGTVESLGGRIRLHTSPGRGAEFRIQLPEAGVKRESETVPKPTRISRVVKPEQAKRAHVLVVEDDEGVRGLIATTLALSSVASTCVGTAAEALEHKGPFSAALVDLTLPDERGDILLGKLRKKGVVTRAAIMSGAPPPADADPDGHPERWLRKPFDPSDLLLAVGALIDSGEGTQNAANS
jgi:signal transduction histidine kinase/ActR/RegA family two-component response regulator